MKKLAIFFTAVFAFISNAANAYEYPWLIFKFTDNSEISVGCENLNITYSGGVLSLTSATVSQQLDVESLQSMRFSAYPAAIEQILSENTGKIILYNVNGTVAGEYESVEDAKNSLSSGIYIVKQKNRTTKIIF